jgi:hypothetical protein
MQLERGCITRREGGGYIEIGDEVFRVMRGIYEKEGEKISRALAILDWLREHGFPPKFVSLLYPLICVLSGLGPRNGESIKRLDKFLSRVGQIVPPPSGSRESTTSC